MSHSIEGEIFLSLDARTTKSGMSCLATMHWTLGNIGVRAVFYPGHPMTTATFELKDEERETLGLRALKFILILGLHAALVAWIAHTQFNTLPEPVTIRLDVRTIDLPPPSAPEAPGPVVEPLKPLPQTARSVVRRPDPVAAQPVLAASPSAATDPAPFVASPQLSTSPKAVEVAALPVPPAPVTSARFDADYLQNPAPAYPAMSRKLHEEGKVLLQVKVTAAGLAEHVQIKQGSGYSRLDEAALNTVRQWRFVPARRGEEPVASSVVVPLVFRLDG
ncbi:MAG: TonB family protein [Burkholderiaceae bacterium]